MEELLRDIQEATQDIRISSDRLITYLVLMGEEEFTEKYGEELEKYSDMLFNVNIVFLSLTLSAIHDWENRDVE